MDNDNGIKKGHTRAGEIGGPSTGVGGVVGQAPPTSSSDACELGGVDSLAPQDAMVTREDQQLLISTGASPAAADAGRSGAILDESKRRRSPRIASRKRYVLSSSSGHDSSVDDDDDYVEEAVERGSRVKKREVLPVSVEDRSTGDDGLKSETAVVKSDDEARTASALWDPRRIFKTKPMEKDDSRIEQEKDRRDSSTVQETEKELGKQLSVDVPRDKDVLEKDRTLLDQYGREDDKLRGQISALGQIVTPMWKHWEGRGLKWQTSTEGNAYKAEILDFTKDMKDKRDRLWIIRDQRKELLKKIERKEGQVEGLSSGWSIDADLPVASFGDSPSAVASSELAGSSGSMVLRASPLSGSAAVPGTDKKDEIDKISGDLPVVVPDVAPVVASPAEDTISSEKKKKISDERFLGVWSEKDEDSDGTVVMEGRSGSTGDIRDPVKSRRSSGLLVPTGNEDFTREQLVTLDQLQVRYLDAEKRFRDNETVAYERFYFADSCEFEEFGDEQTREEYEAENQRIFAEAERYRLISEDLDLEIETIKEKFREENRRRIQQEQGGIVAGRSLIEESTQMETEELSGVDRVVSDKVVNMDVPEASGNDLPCKKSEESPMDVELEVVEAVPMEVSRVALLSGSMDPEKKEEISSDGFDVKRISELPDPGKSEKEGISKSADILPGVGPVKKKEIKVPEIKKKDFRNVVLFTRQRAGLKPGKKLLTSQVKTAVSSGPSVKRITKLAAVSSPAMIERQNKLTTELGKFHRMVVDLSTYLKSNKNIRTAYKDMSNNLPGEFQKIQQIHKELLDLSGLAGESLKQTVVCDAACMTSPVEEKELIYPVERNRDEQGMEICMETESTASFAEILRGGPQKKKKRMDRPLSEEMLMPPPPSRTRDSSEDEEDLERVEELLQLNIDLLIRQQELKSYVQGLRGIESFLLEARLKVNRLKQGRYDPKKIDHTVEVIDRMQRIVDRNRSGGKMEGVKQHGTGLDKEARKKKKQVQEKEWILVAEKGRIPEKALKEPIPAQVVFPALPPSAVDITRGPPLPEKRMTSRPRWSLTRPDAVMITVKDAGEFKTMYDKVDTCPSSVLKHVKKIRKTRVGNLLIELDREGNVNEVKRGLYDVMELGTEIKTLQKACELEIKDVEPTISGDSVVAAMANHLEVDFEELKLKVQRETRGGMQVIVIDAPTKLVDKCLEKPKIKIGHSEVRITPCPKIVRCFRCLAIGHYGGGCTAVIEGNIRCRKCGRDGHNEESCQEALRCKWCAEYDRPVGMLTHRVNSMACPLFREVVNTQKEKLHQSFLEKQKKLKVGKSRRRAQPGMVREGESSDQAVSSRGNIRNSVLVKNRLTPSGQSKAKRKKPIISEGESSA